MQCARCRIDTIRINYPSSRCVSVSGRPLPASVERCPKCGLEWQDVPSTPSHTPAERAVKIKEEIAVSEFEQLSLFESVVGGFK